MAATTTHQPTTTTIHQALTDAPPPPYNEIDNDSDSDSDSEEHDLPHKVTINAGHTVTGSYNTIPISVSPATMANATKMSAALLLAVAKLNDSNAANGSSRRIRLDLTINCGVTVTGSKNVTGSFGLERKVQTNEVTAGDEIVAVAGAKRKADDEDTDVAPAKATKATRRL